MDPFLLHSIILIWASVGAARRVTVRAAELLLAAALLAWGNIVATSLILSVFHRLGEPAWFFCTSILFALLTLLLLLMLSPETSADSRSPNFTEAKPYPWLLGAFALTLAPLAFANLAAAYVYEPNNSDSLTYHLPRAMYYLGQGNLVHFDAADLRQVYLPFNYNLLQLFGFVYGPPSQCLNSFNVVAWALSGVAVYRFCRLCAFGANASLITCWLVLAAPPVIAEASTTTLDLPVGAALLCAFVFGLRWKQTLRTRYAMLSGLAVGLSAGSDLTALLFFLAAGLLFLAWRFQHRQAQGHQGLRAWILSAVLACTLSLPFALINLEEKGSKIGWVVAFLIRGPKTETTLNTWIGSLPLFGKSSPLLTLNEDIVGFGLVGLLFLICSAYCVLPGRKSPGWFAWSGFGWAILLLLLNRWQLSSPRELVPALLLMGPCVAAAIESIGTSQLVPRYAGYLVVVVVALATGWSSGNYLLGNSNRPVAPMLNTGFLPPALPALPMLLEHHLSSQSRINIDTDGVNERIFPLMTQGHGQRFTSRSKIDPDSYNLLSRSSRSRTAPYRNLEQVSSYLYVPIATKRTAGVELLGTIGSGATARDYFGIGPQAGRTAPVETNRNVLLTLSHEPRPKGNPEMVHFRLEGLNSEDHVRLAVDLVYDDDSISHVATFTSDGEALLVVDRPFHWLDVKALDAETGTKIVSTAISYLPQVVRDLKPLDSIQPTSASSIFVTDLVLSRNTNVTASAGLLPTEGPFPQWDLPYIRWARQPSILVSIPPVPGLASLQLSFSVRLHARGRGALEVLFNGHVVQDYRMEGRTTWLDQTLTLTPQPGENVVEFRNLALKNELDWEDYLRRYPDVLKHLVTHNLPLEQGAREHYELKGRAEGRTIQTVEASVPDSYYFMFRNIRLEGFKSP